MFEWIVEIISKGGHLGIAVLTFLENVFPPIPSELVMPMGGYLADLGKLSFWPVVLAGTLGSTLGQLLLYYAGRQLGEERLKSWAEKHGHWMAMSPEQIDHAGDWFARKRGSMAVFLGRLLPGIRSLISIPAGVVRMPMASFLPFTVLGTFVWTAALTYAGAVVGRNTDKIHAFLNPLAYLTLGLCLGGYVYRVVKGYRRKQERSMAPDGRRSQAPGRANVPHPGWNTGSPRVLVIPRLAPRRQDDRNNLPKTGNLEVYLNKSDGSGFTNLTKEPGNDLNPSIR